MDFSSGSTKLRNDSASNSSLIAGVQILSRLRILPRGSDMLLLDRQNIPGPILYSQLAIEAQTPFAIPSVAKTNG